MLCFIVVCCCDDDDGGGGGGGGDNACDSSRGHGDDNVSVSGSQKKYE